MMRTRSLTTYELEEFADCFGANFDELSKPILGVVRDPVAHFKEDPLRLLRAIRFAAHFGWAIEEATWMVLKDSTVQHLVMNGVSKKSLGIEFVYTIESTYPEYGMQLLLESGLAQRLLEAAIEGSEYEGNMFDWTMEQNNPHHKLTLDQHTLQVLKNSLPLHRNDNPEKRLLMRLTAICHDLGKMYQPVLKITEMGYSSFHGHEDHSAILAELLLNFLEIDCNVAYVKTLVQYHMRPHALIKEGSKKALRKLFHDLKEEQVDWRDLFKQSEADGTAKDVTFGPHDEDYLQKSERLRGTMLEIEQEEYAGFKSIEKIQLR